MAVIFGMLHTFTLSMTEKKRWLPWKAFCFLQMELLQQSLLESAVVSASFRAGKNFGPIAPGSSPWPCRAGVRWKDLAVADVAAVAAREVSPSAPCWELGITGCGCSDVSWRDLVLISRGRTSPGELLLLVLSWWLGQPQHSRGSSTGLGWRQAALPGTRWRPLRFSCCQAQDRFTQVSPSENSSFFSVLSLQQIEKFPPADLPVTCTSISPCDGSDGCPPSWLPSDPRDTVEPDQLQLMQKARLRFTSQILRGSLLKIHTWLSTNEPKEGPASFQQL